MPQYFIRNDITQMNTDAIVIPANEELKQGSGTSRGIFEAAGEEALEAACREIGHCDMGHAVMTGGFKLPAKYIIHAVCPRWYDGESNEEELLYSAYADSLRIAKEQGLKSVAFPLLSAGNYEYPRDKALNVASHAFADFLAENEMDIYLVFYDKESVRSGNRLYDVDERIGDEYVENKDETYGCHAFAELSRAELREMFPEAKAKWEKGRQWQRSLDTSTLLKQKTKAAKVITQESLEALLKNVEETFSERLRGFVDRSERTKKDIYTRSNVTKKQFYKLLQDPYTKPKKATVLGLAVGLELNVTETRALLASAGYAFSPSSGADIIVEHFIRNRNFSHIEINSALYENGYEDELIGTIK